MKARDIARRLRVDTHAYRGFRRRLRAMERDGQVIRQSKGRYGLPGSFEIVTGVADVTRSGDAFIVPDQAGGEDVFVPRRYLGSAVEGDRVAVRVERRSPGRNPEGRLVRVLERAWAQAVGVYRNRRGYGVVVPQEPPLPADIFVPASDRAEAEDGDIVLVRIGEWGTEGLRPVGTIELVLGRPGDPGVDVLSIILGQQLPVDFPPGVEKEAEKIGRRGIRPEDLTDREDFREVLCFTIDPASARDHDDALSVRRTNGSLEIGIHIADVSWYVKEGSAIDREALERGTSVYLVDRVIPMLPEALSSDLCSLVPGEDRLTLSVVLTYDAQGNETSTRLVRGVIRSAHKLSYEQAQAVLSGEDPTDTADPDLIDGLRDIQDTARAIRKARAEGGSVDFAIPEAEVVLDESGEPLEIRPRQRLETHRIIEDLMIRANEAVAELGIERGLPLVFRIHEEPDPDRIDSLRQLASFFGHGLPAGPVRPSDLSRLLAEAADQPHEYLISTVTLRSMKRARYSTENVGHFGLASDAYVHFTSPIRRYPDLAVHRAIVRWLRGSAPLTDEGLQEVARHSSDTERRAQEAERESVEAKKIRYMQRHVGDEFGGTIGGVTSFGLFVQLDDVLTEGLVRLSSLVDDYYSYDADGHAVQGRRTRKRYRLGDRVTVQVIRVDTESRTIDLELVEGTA
ncbi:MAG: ribonuclease R [marine benthic group bacterium]|nr:ribonuclease R [Candidatus Benthicola marisminoris]